MAVAPKTGELSAASSALAFESCGADCFSVQRHLIGTPWPNSRSTTAGSGQP
eukprot:CAMPEP_0202113512 /NCGR_PEP_ID=MMETSP0965-20130614/34047_1 /ASSEMBLY_ACC=CAM_ASM_000507 /TAXON_ID=4773 /ORGANISM="Schizochytrium aggregatum, Strain ATCC28209" /LENGTH=51 /DNA_ID=CAMNT_0048683137 /DNA_START=86 /DNA_END=237 /DNA_ORIENTATION=+